MAIDGVWHAAATEAFQTKSVRHSSANGSCTQIVEQRKVCISHTKTHTYMLYYEHFLVIWPLPINSSKYLEEFFSWNFFSKKKRKKIVEQKGSAEEGNEKMKCDMREKFAESEPKPPVPSHQENRQVTGNQRLRIRISLLVFGSAFVSVCPREWAHKLSECLLIIRV